MKISNAVLVLLIACQFSGVSYAADRMQASSGSSDEWQIKVAPYLWMAGIDGDITVRGREASIDMSFSDIFENLDFGGMAHFELTKGKWSAFVNPIYLKLSDDARGRNFRADLKYKQSIVEFGGLYRIGEFSIGDGPMSSIELMAGGRYTYMKAKLSIQGTGPFGLGTKFEQSKDWLDPIVGGRLKLNFTDRVMFLTTGDIGGFGVGSDFSWKILAALGYRFNLFGADASFLGGYQALYRDFGEGSGLGKVALETTLHGPIVGLLIRF